MTDHPVEPPDPARRRFFRQFAGDLVTSVGSVLGAAQVLQQQSADAARELLGTSEPVVAPAPPPVEVDAATAGYRAAFRWDGDVCRLVDQSRLPDILAEREVRSTVDLVTAINDGALIGSAVQAQVAAVTLALVAGRSILSRPFARRATIRGAANALRLNRPGSAALVLAVDRQVALLESLGQDDEGAAVVTALTLEAEAILLEAQAEHGALVEHAAAALPGGPGDPLRVLTIGSTGAMGGGLSGTALSAILALHHAGRPIHALVAETRPLFEGSRIAAWELRQAGASHAVVTDAAAPGCIAAGEVSAVLVAADRVAANGDVIAIAGTYPLALAAAEAGIPFLVCAPVTSLDLATRTGGAARIEEGRPGSVLRAAGTRIAPEGTQIRNPLQDLTPADLVTAIVTGEGVLRPPYGPAIAAAVAAADARRTSPGFAALVAKRVAEVEAAARAAAEAAARAEAAEAEAATQAAPIAATPSAEAEAATEAEAAVDADPGAEAAS
jgi:methylthioribose-1-phosphate isomerase